MADWSLPIQIAKTDADENLVFGWASVVEKDGHTVVDSQGDVIDISELEKAAYEFVLEEGHAGEMHQRTTGVGKLVESVVFTKAKHAAMGLPPGSTPLGWWCGFKLADDVFALVKSGHYSAFSIGGSALRREARR